MGRMLEVMMARNMLQITETHQSLRNVYLEWRTFKWESAYRKNISRPSSRIAVLF